MNGNFQLACLAIAASLVAIRALLVWRGTRVYPFKTTHPIEALFALGEVVFGLLIFRSADIVKIPLPALADLTIVTSESARVLGAILIAAGILIFALALFSFGNSWRIGID